MTKVDTKCVQSGYTPKNGEARVLPIYQSTTYKYDTPEEMGDLFDPKREGFFYTRLANPTVDGLERKIADLDGGIAAMGCASGMLHRWTSFPVRGWSRRHSASRRRRPAP